ncbi:hypothetical protein GCM10010191_21140 [Actinomadura vinacea]|uniref:Biotin carboxyl carrier protein of acetyl-CoA carboxylase n=1 Tax=Actinomadura vinacea TaxID=115336 RepID=A0ABP5VTK2_9ACTN
MTETPAAAPGTASPELLEALVGQVARLAGAGSVPPSSVRLRAGELSVEVDWPGPAAPAAPPAPAPPAAPGAVPDSGPAGVPVDGGEADARHTLDAPLVGVFYRCPEPGADPFVREGDVVDKGRQVGIVEAMKLMNPLEADQAGRIVEFLVADGEPVEYGQPILLLEPDGPA